MSLSFAFPAALLLLVLVPLAAWLFRRANRALPLPRAGAMRAGEEPRIRLPGRLPEILRGVTLTALVLGIAGPTFSRTVVEEKSLGVPIVLAVDISSSMLARDFQPLDRLEVAKATLTRFVEGRPNDPIALVAFAAEALTLVPATTHRAVLLSSIESLRVGMVEDGTAVGDGLAV
ncbi:MAG: VWA domain-containing protein, partial [Gemmatimonadota bacterium]|nr:VWA domain-containing protein [Gemmatimonadota bacterium]